MSKIDSVPLEQSRLLARDVLDGLAAHVCVLDQRGMVITVNRAWREFQRASGGAESVLNEGSSYLAACENAANSNEQDAGDAREFLSLLWEVLAGQREYFEREYRCDLPAGRRWFVARVSRIAGSNPIRVVVAHDDVTALKLTHEALEARERKLAESERRFSAFLNTLPAAAFIKDQDGVTVFANVYMERMLGVSGWAGRSTRELFPPDIAEQMLEDDRRCIEAGFLLSEETVPCTDGVLRHFETYKFRIPREGEPPLLGGIALDITERRAMQEGLHMTRFSVEAASDAIFWITRDGRIVDVNAAACCMLGYSRAELLSMPVGDLDDESADSAWAAGLDELRCKGTIRVETVQRRKDGELIPVEVVSNYVRFGDDERNCAIVRDIAERRRFEEQIRQLAFYDPLTGLPNRRLLDDRLHAALSTSRRKACYGAALFLDLDAFKPLNDTHGHHAGDLLLIEVARRLKDAVREMDTVARLGGDEFVVVLGELSELHPEATAQVRRVAEKIHDAVAEPYLLAVQGAGSPAVTVEYSCTTSIGVAMFGAREGSGDEVLRRADAALYEAKALGRNRVRYVEASR
ncbi:MAG: diguanylate cyclase [Gammaproteobacteria bacterium]|nr:diguanylate cyclase [Gammaproteobacteria bacterium]